MNQTRLTVILVYVKAVSIHLIVSS